MSTPGARDGSRFGPYVLVRLLGRGGMGEVYRADDAVRGRTVALKLLPTDLASDDSYRRRFEREARIAARLTNPHIIPIHDFGEIDGTLFIDMRLVVGADLSDVLMREHRLEPSRALAIVRQIAGALDAAHRDGLVHRDVKPANIMVTEDDFAYLADFGIATRTDEERLTDDGSAVGSFAYMAPERFEGEQAGPSSDIYSLAAVYYELVTGSTLFPGRSISGLIRAHCTEDPPHLRDSVPSLGPKADAAVQRALSKNPSHRFATATEFVGALVGAQTTGGVAHRARGASSDSHDNTTHVGAYLTATPNPGKTTNPLAAQPPSSETDDRFEESNGRSDRGKAWLLAALAIVVIAVGGFAAYQQFGTQGSADTTSSTPVLPDAPSGSGSESESSTPSSSSSALSASDVVSFASPSGYTACTMNAETGVVCTSFRRNYQPPPQAQPGCGWSIALRDNDPGFVCDPETMPSADDDAQQLGSTRRSATRIGSFPVLEHGQAVSVGRYICSITAEYVACRNSDTGKGFRIAGSSYQLTP